jgi:hypothetical protein
MKPQIDADFTSDTGGTKTAAGRAVRVTPLPSVISISVHQC